MEAKRRPLINATLNLVNVALLNNDLRSTPFVTSNDRNTLVTNDNIHDKVCFLFNNTDSHISRLTVNPHLKDERNIINYTIPLYLHFLKFSCLLLFQSVTPVQNGNTE